MGITIMSKCPYLNLPLSSRVVAERLINNAPLCRGSSTLTVNYYVDTDSSPNIIPDPGTSFVTFSKR